MTANPTGGLVLAANGKEYRLHLGFSVLADVQAKHGAEFDKLFNGDSGPVPNLGLVRDLFLGALERHHPDEVDAYLVDDLIAQNVDALGLLMGSSMPSAEGKALAKPARKR